MQVCKGCRQQRTNDTLCLVCIEDLSFWLRQIPDLYHELGSVRLPGSVRTSGPKTKSTSHGGSAAPVRLEVLDLLDRGETLRRLWDWTDERSLDVRAICDGFRSHLLGIVAEDWAGDFYWAMRSLCRDLGRAVGEPEDRPIGKCSEPVDGDELCRGQLFRTPDGGSVYCRRCGHRPALLEAQVWVSLEQAARLTGRPIETVRTWYKRGKLNWSVTWANHSDPSAGWSGPIGPQPARQAWLPAAVRLANAVIATFPHSSATVNHEIGAELSQDQTLGLRTGSSSEGGSGSDADVLGRSVPGGSSPASFGNVTPSAGALAGKAVAPTPNDPAPHPGSGGQDPATLDGAGSSPRSAGPGSSPRAVGTGPS